MPDIVLGAGDSVLNGPDMAACSWSLQPNGEGVGRQTLIT